MIPAHKPKDIAHNHAHGDESFEMLGVEPMYTRRRQGRHQGRLRTPGSSASAPGQRQRRTRHTHTHTSGNAFIIQVRSTPQELLRLRIVESCREARARIMKRSREAVDEAPVRLDNILTKRGTTSTRLLRVVPDRQGDNNAQLYS